MNNDSTSTMQKYGISCKPKNIYHYKGYQYSNLQDAINYAKHDQKRAEKKLLEK